MLPSQHQAAIKDMHGALLAVVEDSGLLDEAMVKAQNDHQLILDQVRACMSRNEQEPSICSVGETGSGRLLLSAAMHDGATVFSKSGELLGIGRIVRSDDKIKSKEKGKGEAAGSRTHAAKALARHGVVLKVS